jgi:tetratricopeptide (TPR) repeat protein
MRRKFLFLFPVFQIALYLCLAAFPAAGQTIDIQQALIGEWRGPEASFNGKKYPLTVVFARDGDGLKAFISRNMNLDEDRRSRFYTAADLRTSGKGVSFVIKGTALTVFYEGEFSPGDETLTMHFSYELPSQPERRITWNLKKAPLCHDPEEMSVAARELWEDRRAPDAQSTLLACFPVDLYDDQVSLLYGLVILRGAELVLPAYGSYGNGSRYEKALGPLNRSLKLNQQNPLTWYAMAYIYYEQALRENSRLNSFLGNISKDPAYRKWPPQQIETEKEKSNRLSLKLLDDSIACYTGIISINAFETDAYIKRAQAHYAKWSKCEPDPEYLKSSLKDYKAAIELNPLSHELFYERAMI